MTDGCGPTVACGSMLAKMVQGMSLEGAEGDQPGRSDHCSGRLAWGERPPFGKLRTPLRRTGGEHVARGHCEPASCRR
jgi:hypothetical protein